MLRALGVIAAVAAPAAAHLAFWDPSMYGFDDYMSYNPLGFPNWTPKDQWWFHGMIDKPPQDGKFFELPAGGTAHAQIACKKEYTKWGNNPSGKGDACPEDPKSRHEHGPDQTKGSAIAIAYNSDVRSIKQEDFVVISVNHRSPWYVDADFQIPAGLPECPPGGCHCMWGWVHGQEAGGEEMYFNGFRCKVTNPGNRKLAKPKAPVRCGEGDCSGAKQPLYFSQVENANVQMAHDGPPSYNDRYGWKDGAQDDIFDGQAEQTNQKPTQGTNQQGQQQQQQKPQEQPKPQEQQKPHEQQKPQEQQQQPTQPKKEWNKWNNNNNNNNNNNGGQRHKHQQGGGGHGRYRPQQSNNPMLDTNPQGVGQQTPPPQPQVSDDEQCEPESDPKQQKGGMGSTGVPVSQQQQPAHQQESSQPQPESADEQCEPESDPKQQQGGMNASGAQPVAQQLAKTEGANTIGGVDVNLIANAIVSALGQVFNNKKAVPAPTGQPAPAGKRSIVYRRDLA